MGLSKPQNKLEAVYYLVGERLFRLFLGFFIHAWMARSLTPADFGYITYIVKGVSIYYAFGLFGNDEILIAELLAKDLKTKKDVLKTVLYLRLIAGTIGLLALVIVTGIFSEFGSEIWLWTAVFGISIPLQAFTVYELPLIANMQMKTVFQVRNSSYLFGVFLKSLGLIKGIAKNTFVLIYFLEDLSWKFLASFSAYKNGMFGGTFDRNLAYKILKPSVLTVLASFLMLLDQRLAFFILDNISTPDVLGNYAIVVTLMDIALLVPISLTTALFPSVVNEKQKSDKEYKAAKQHFFNWLIIIGVLCALTLNLLAPYIIDLLYNQKYQNSIPLLKGMAFTAILSFFNLGRLKIFALEGELFYWICLLSSGVLIQTFLIFFLYPVFGLESIYIGTLFGQIIPNIIFIGFAPVRESTLYIFNWIKSLMKMF